MRKNLLLRSLQIFIVVCALFIFIFLLWEPQAEWVNTHKTLSEIYFMDPFVIVVYSVALVFFAALYQIFQSIQYYIHGDIKKMLTSLRKARYLIPPVIFSVIYWEIFIFLHESDDRAGWVFMVNLILIILILLFTGMMVMEKKLRGK